MVEGLYVEGLPAPLFDRLRLAKTPNELQSLGMASRCEVAASVRWELEQLFNTRSPTPTQRYAEQMLTVIDYGIPDLLEFCPQNSAERYRLAVLLTKAVDAFEPRLTQVQIVVEPQEGKPQALLVQLEARLVVVKQLEPVCFTVEVTRRGCTCR
ncbi:MAG: type VI secretion system baseplate subunit TssE [Oscillochloris sp.]|nr:type VI secretion system baseplate subunit TssE [Oscillochloris sp.]